MSMVKVLMMARTPSWPVRLHTTVWPLMYNSSSLHVSTLSRSSLTLTPPAPWNTHRSFCQHSKVQPFSECQSSTHQHYLLSVSSKTSIQTDVIRDNVALTMITELRSPYSLHCLVLRHITIKIVSHIQCIAAKQKSDNQCSSGMKVQVLIITTLGQHISLTHGNKLNNVARHRTV